MKPPRSRIGIKAPPRSLFYNISFIYSFSPRYTWTPFQRENLLDEKSNNVTKRITRDPDMDDSASDDSGFIFKHGNYQALLSFQKAEVVYDITFRFAHRYLEKKDRTVDQMVQAARSGK